MPAPPLGSEPAIVSALGTTVSDYNVSTCYALHGFFYSLCSQSPQSRRHRLRAIPTTRRGIRIRLSRSLRKKTSRMEITLRLRRTRESKSLGCHSLKANVMHCLSLPADL